MADEMVIFVRTFDLLEWLLPKSDFSARGANRTSPIGRLIELSQA
jgi:hypothetical protein